MSSNPPLIPGTKWDALEALLPPKARDRQLISAIVFRHSSAVGLRDVSELFGLSRARINEWETKLERDGSLGRVMSALRLEPAGQLSWRRGGQSWARRSGTSSNIIAFKLTEFAEQLKRGAQPKTRKPPATDGDAA